MGNIISMYKTLQEQDGVRLEKHAFKSKYRVISFDDDGTLVVHCETTNKQTAEESFKDAIL